MPQHVFIRTTKTIYFIQMDFSCIVQFRPEDFNSFVIISYNNLSKLPFIFQIFFFLNIYLTHSAWHFRPLLFSEFKITHKKKKLEFLSCFHFISFHHQQILTQILYTREKRIIYVSLFYLQMKNQNHTFCFSSSFH